MKKKIYIKLLDEGTIVYKPIPSIEIESNIYKVQGHELYDMEDEIWEFPPDTYVLVEERYFSGEKVLVAIKEQRPSRIS